MEGIKKLFADTMECTIVPPLEYQALLRVAVLLWNHEPFRHREWLLFDHMTHPYLQEQLQLVERHIIRLPLPVMLKNELKRFNVAIGGEIYKWTEYHLSKYDLEVHIPKPLCWKPSGIINYKKTAELLIQDRSISISPRFFLACMYGFEDFIKELWHALPQDEQEDLLYSDVDFLFYWANELTDYDSEGSNGEEMNTLFTEELPDCVFQASIRMCDPPVSEYFFHKLNPTEKQNLPNLFKDVANSVYERFPRHAKPKFVYTDVLCFLLHKLDGQQQEIMFKIYPFPVLLCFLEWPKQEFFMEMAEGLVKFLLNKHFGYLLKKIALKVVSAKDFNYSELFRHCWLQSDESQKNYAIGSSSCWCAIYHLFSVGDFENIEMIFSNANEAQKRRFFKSNWGRRIRI